VSSRRGFTFDPLIEAGACRYSEIGIFWKYGAWSAGPGDVDSFIDEKRAWSAVQADYVERVRWLGHDIAKKYDRKTKKDHLHDRDRVCKRCRLLARSLAYKVGNTMRSIAASRSAETGDMQRYKCMCSLTSIEKTLVRFRGVQYTN
jgi:hypothetical protein